MSTYPVSGAGLGYRRPMASEISDVSPDQVNFMEVVPENWIGLGGSAKRQLKAVTERFPMVIHGLSLSIGGPGKLDTELVKTIGKFMKEHNILSYTEHLSYCSDDGLLYDLMPIPFTEEAVHHTAARIRQVQDILGQRIGMENVSYYAAPGQEMSEIEFINAVIDEADCGLLLDVNNIYVNSINHRYDAEAYLKQLPANRVEYLHIAGHYDEAEDLRVDTHGADVIDPVWHLLEVAYQQFGVMPTLLERDNNIPPMADLLLEVDRIAAIQKQYAEITQEQGLRV